MNKSNNTSGTDKNDISQIAMITNNKSLVAVCDSLQLAKIGGDKSPAAIHSKNSRIKITIIDFTGKSTEESEHEGYSRNGGAASPDAGGKKRSKIVSFYLKPAEIRRIYRKVLTVTGTRDYKVTWSKKKEKPNKVIAESLTISREPYMNTEKTTAARYPWKIRISSGEYKALDSGGGKKNYATKPTYDNNVLKVLTDEEMEDLLSTVTRYIEVWEIVHGAPLLRKIQEEIEKKFREDDESAEVTIDESDRPASPSLPPAPPKCVYSESDLV